MKLYRELAQRIDRKKKLDGMISKAQTHRNLMGKGRHKKIVVLDEFGEEDKSKTQYKWKLQRKK